MPRHYRVARATHYDKVRKDLAPPLSEIKCTCPSESRTENAEKCRRDYVKKKKQEWIEKHGSEEGWTEPDENLRWNYCVVHRTVVV
jgi:hypothetical protein